MEAVRRENHAHIKGPLVPNAAHSSGHTHCTNINNNNNNSNNNSNNNNTEQNQQRKARWGTFLVVFIFYYFA